MGDRVVAGFWLTSGLLAGVSRPRQYGMPPQMVIAGFWLTSGLLADVSCPRQYGMSPQMQKYMKARATAMGDSSGGDVDGPIGQVNFKSL